MYSIMIHAFRRRNNISHFTVYKIPIHITTEDCHTIIIKIKFRLKNKSFFAKQNEKKIQSIYIQSTKKVAL